MKPSKGERVAPRAARTKASESAKGESPQPEAREDTSARGGRRSGNTGRVPRGPSSREVIKTTANQARKLGWEEVEHFNVVVAFGDAIWMLYQELAAWYKHTTAGKSRGDRRDARRIVHCLRNVLRDLGQDIERVDAVANGETKLLLVSGIQDIPEVKPDTMDLCMRLAWARFNMALGADQIGTTNRAALLIRAIDRLGRRFQAMDIVPPIARVREGAARPYAPPGRVVRPENGEQETRVEKETDRSEERTSEARSRGGTARTARPYGANAPAANAPARRAVKMGEAIDDPSKWEGWD